MLDGYFLLYTQDALLGLQVMVCSAGRCHVTNRERQSGWSRENTVYGTYSDGRQVGCELQLWLLF